MYICSKLAIGTLKKDAKYAKLTIKAPEQSQGGRSGVIIVNFKHILHFFLLFQLLNLNRQIFARFL